MRLYIYIGCTEVRGKSLNVKKRISQPALSYGGKGHYISITIFRETKKINIFIIYLCSIHNSSIRKPLLRRLRTAVTFGDEGRRQL